MEEEDGGEEEWEEEREEEWEEEREEERWWKRPMVNECWR